MTALTDLERRAVADARELAALPLGTVRDYVGETDLALAYASAFGRAQYVLAELVAMADRLCGADDDDQAAEDTRRLGAIRDLLAKFDWEYHDRQLALEAIERIVNQGGLPMDVPTDQFAALAARVEEMAAEVAELREQAFVMRTLEEIHLQRVYGVTPQVSRPALKAPNLRLLRGKP